MAGGVEKFDLELADLEDVAGVDLDDIGFLKPATRLAPSASCLLR